VGDDAAEIYGSPFVSQLVWRRLFSLFDAIVIKSLVMSKRVFERNAVP